MKDPIDTLTRRTQRYWYIDGLNELATGFLITLVGAVFFLFSLPALAAWRNFSTILQLAIILGGAWASGSAITAIKERITYPRTGYVTYPHRKGKTRFLRAILGGFVGIALGIFIGIIGRQPSVERWLPLISAFAAALAILFIGFRFELTRYNVLAVYTVLVGYLASNLPERYADQEFPILACLLGVGFLVSGALTLVHYLRTTQPPSETGLE